MEPQQVLQMLLQAAAQHLTHMHGRAVAAVQLRITWQLAATLLLSTDANGCTSAANVTIEQNQRCSLHLQHLLMYFVTVQQPDLQMLLQVEVQLHTCMHGPAAEVPPQKTTLPRETICYGNGCQRLHFSFKCNSH